MESQKMRRMKMLYVNCPSIDLNLFSVIEKTNDVLDADIRTLIMSIKVTMNFNDEYELI